MGTDSGDDSAWDRALVDALPVAVALVDPSLTIRRANPAFTRLTGVSVGEPVTAAVAGEAQARLRQTMARSLVGAEAHGHTTEPLAAILDPPSGATPAVLDWRILMAADGTIGGLCLTVACPAPPTAPANPPDGAGPLDMTRMLAAASHDLRQPLQVLAMIHGLLRHWDDAETRDLLDDMQGQLAAMAEVVDTFLYVDRLEGGGLAPATAPVAVAPMLQKIASEVRPLARAAGLRLRVVATSAVVISDRVLLEQMLRNLVSNAIRYTVTGGVVMGCRRRGSDVAIQVVDSGIGIAPYDLERIVQPFFRAADDAAGTTRRLGLGLAIVDRLARRLDHRLLVRSEIGRGSAFAVVAPRAAADSRPAPVSTAQSVPLADVPSVLVGLVEDDPRVARVTERLLGTLGCQVAAGTHASDVLAALKRHDGPPDLLLVDYRLPGDDDGVSVIAAVRAALGRPIPAIVVTGDSTPETIRRIESHGHVHIPKPVDLARLQQEMRRLLLDSVVGAGETA